MAVRRNTDEDWIEWIRKATHLVLDRAERAGVREWTRYHHERKWMWAGHVARSSASSWLYKVSTYRDSAWQALCNEVAYERELRPSTRRWVKWEDGLRRFCAHESLPQWTDLALNREKWHSLKAAYVAWASCPSEASEI